MPLQLHYTTLRYTTLHYTTPNCTTLHLQLQPQLHYAALHYTTLDPTALHYPTVHYARPYTSTIQLQMHYTNCGTPQLQLHYITATTATALHHSTYRSCGWGDYCNHCNHSEKHSPNHLSVHQWIRSAIRDSQRPPSPIGFLFWNFRRLVCGTTGMIWSIHVVIPVNTTLFCRVLFRSFWSLWSPKHRFWFWICLKMGYPPIPMNWN